MENLKVTIIQANLIWENKMENLQRFSYLIKNIREETDLIILPEMFTTGFTMNAASLAESMDDDSFRHMRKWATEKNCAVTGSIIVSENGKYYNRLIWMTPDSFEVYDKRHLFALSKEDNTYTRGEKKIIVTLKGWKILPLICYDLRFPVWSRRTKKENYDLLLYVANWPERRVYAWKSLLTARSIENQSYVAGVNRVGNDGNGIYHSGESAVVDFKGEKLSETSEGNEFVQTLTLNHDELLKFRKQFAFFEDGDEFELLEG